MTEKTNHPDPLLCREQVLARVPISPATLYRLISQGQFPRPIKFGKSAFWSTSSIEHAIKLRSAPDDSSECAESVRPLAPKSKVQRRKPRTLRGFDQ